MAKYEAKIKTKFGEFTIPFENKEELQSKLKDAEELVKIIDTEARKFAALEGKPVIGHEDIMVKTDGLIRLIKVPDTTPQRVVLAVYGYYPMGGSINQISKSSGVLQVSRKYLTHRDNRKNFIKLSSGNYSLSSEGLKLANEIVRGIRRGELKKKLEKRREEAQKE